MKKGRVALLAAGLVACFTSILVFGFSGTSLAAPADAGVAHTGVGLAEHALKAYRQGWKYQYGCYGQFVGGVRRTDCSGLIKSYLWWTGEKTNPKPGLVSVAGGAGGMLASAAARGNINLSNSSTLPRIHGLCLYSPGHAGVYVGSNYSVDNRCDGENVKYGPVIGGRYHWTTWFKLPQIQYPSNGFVSCDGNLFYYENGQYVVSTSRTVNGTAYHFDAAGKVIKSDTASAEKALQAAMNSQSPRVMQLGMSGSDVLAVQKKLCALGYISTGDCTGYYGPVTRSAVLTYQRFDVIPQTGVVDAKTRHDLRV